MSSCLISEVEAIDLQQVSSLNSLEDCSTFVECFESALSAVRDSSHISGCRAKGNGYAFVESADGSGEFDFYEVLQELSGNREVNCVNVRFLYPKAKSRGTSCVSEPVNVEELPTGYIDVSEDGTRVLYYQKLNMELPISESGIIIGRSSKRSDYVIRDNINISRQHAKVYKRNGKVYVHNYEPPNGTFVDGLRMPVNTDKEVRLGGKLLLADEEFKVL